MKALVFAIVLVFALSHAAIAVEFAQYNATISANGPAPNSGDGVPDGSGNDSPYGPKTGK